METLKEDLNKDVDTILSEILTDWQNQDPSVDVSKGSMTYMKSACLASAKWGALQTLKYVMKQIFPDTADTENLEHHAWLRDLARKSGESKADYLARLLNRLRRPPAGGNDNDYEQWALKITNVTKAYCYPLAQGLGTVDLLILADKIVTSSEVPSSHADKTGSSTSVTASKLEDSAATFVTWGFAVGDEIKNTDTDNTALVTAVDDEDTLSLDADIFTETGEGWSARSLVTQVQDYIDGVRPTTVKDFRTLAPTVQSQDVTMTVTGDNAALPQIKSDIEAYINALEPDQKLYVAQLVAIAIQNGADTADVTTPAGDVTPATYEMIRPGTVTVS
jgi:uncharacterized phage protein gp47/JayE